MAELFKQNVLFISKKCVNLISELESYAYPDKSPNHNEQEAPIKEKDHLLDALRYLVMGFHATKREPIIFKQPEYQSISDYEAPTSGNRTVRHDDYKSLIFDTEGRWHNPLDR